MAFRAGIVERSVEDNNSPGLEVERIRELIFQLTDARLVCSHAVRDELI